MLNEERVLVPFAEPPDTLSSSGPLLHRDGENVVYEFWKEGQLVCQQTIHADSVETDCAELCDYDLHMLGVFVSHGSHFKEYHDLALSVLECLKTRPEFDVHAHRAA